MHPEDAYEALADLAERELLLVTRGALDGLPGLRRERASLIAGLPATPPAGARPALVRCAGLQRRVAEELERLRGELLGRMRELGRAQRTAAGYRPPRAPGHRVFTAA